MFNRLMYSIKYCEPIRKMYAKMLEKFFYKKWLHSPMELADDIFYKRFGRRIDWNNPMDFNEKINWLKFHCNQHIWADLADKYKVRDYVRERGLEGILVPIVGKYENAQDLLDDWDNLPDEFVIKSNNGCSHVLIVSNDINIGKKKEGINKRALLKMLEKWLHEKRDGIINVEMHYQFIKNCLIVEKLLKEDSLREISKSPIDYKIFCANGEPYMCYVTYDRDPITHERFEDFYDTDWNRRTDYLSEKSKVGAPIVMPKNWDLMLEYAKKLSDGHPQVRVDFYNIEGEIYFGEMTLTTAGGFGNFFRPKFSEEFGKKIKIDLNMPGNEFYHMNRK